MEQEINEVEISGKNGDTVIDIEASTEIFSEKTSIHGQSNQDPLQISIQQALDVLPGDPHITRPVTIFRVPIFRKSLKNLHEPQMVSIGPYYHGKQSLQPLEKHKWWLLRDFLSRKTEIGMEVYLNEMRSMEKEVRQCYNDVIEMSSDEFASMLLLDGCFILEYFLKCNEGEKDYVTDVGWDKTPTDISLLENQIPFSVIHKLGTIYFHGTDRNCDNLECPVLNLICKNTEFEDLFSSTPKLSCTEIDHLLHLNQLRMIAAFDMDQTSNPNQTSNLDQTSNPDKVSKPDETGDMDQTSEADQSSNPDETGDMDQTSEADQSSNTNSDQSLSIKARCLSWLRSKLHLEQEEVYDSGRIPSATELSEAGITFKKKKDPRNIFDITFDYKKGVMELPSLAIQDYTKIIFTNVLLYEQAQKSRSTKPIYITSYLILMDFLIDTTEDAALLKHSGILTNLLQDDEEVALFFNELCDYTNIDLAKSYYSSLCTQVLKYSNSPRHKYRAMLVRDYFSNPWAVISFFAAILLLLLTVTQTGFSIYPVVHHN